MTSSKQIEFDGFPEAMTRVCRPSRLEEVDWSFTKREPAPIIEKIHPYPAKFIGDIPRSLLSLLPLPQGARVLDPFCGSGTTLVEAQRLGLSSVGIDLNPIACLISRVKTQNLPENFSEVVWEVIESARRLDSFPKPDIPNVDHWFKPDIQDAVGALAEVIKDPRFFDWHDQLRLALSSILVRVSNQDSDTRYAAVEKNVSGSDVFDLYYRSAQKLERALLNRSWDLVDSRVIEKNVLKASAADVGGGVGAVVTSPPYPNAYEYWLYHKYRMWWLGFDPLAVKGEEIGARAHFFKTNGHTADMFEEQMDSVLSLLESVVVPRGFACFVVGRSKIHGEIVDNAAVLERVAEKHSFKPYARFERVLSSNRKSFNLSHANIKTESVLVFEKC